MTHPLHDVGEWPDGRLLELAERRASYDAYDVASLAAHTLKLRRGLQKVARGDYCTPACTAYVKAMALLGCPHTPTCPGCSPVRDAPEETAEMPAALSVLETLHAMREAAHNCSVDSNNPDTCGVCHKHFEECEQDRVWHDDSLPMNLENSLPGCPGARLRAVLVRTAMRTDSEAT